MTRLTGRRVLVVEDEALVAMLVEDALLDAGAAVVGPAATVSEALSLLSKENPDVAVLDLNLAGETSTPVAILERAQVGEALRRSAYLTRDHRISIFGVLLVVALISAAVTQIFRVIFLSEPGDLAPTLDYLKYYMICVDAFGVVQGALAAVPAAVAYNDLRARKEGLDTDEIASVFD